MSIYERIRSALKKFRGKRTTEEAAAALGVSKQTYDNWLCKQKPGKFAKMMLIEKLQLNKQIKRIK